MDGLCGAFLVAGAMAKPKHLAKPAAMKVTKAKPQHAAKPAAMKVKVKAMKAMKAMKATKPVKAKAQQPAAMMKSVKPMKSTRAARSMRATKAMNSTKAKKATRAVRKRPAAMKATEATTSTLPKQWVVADHDLQGLCPHFYPPDPDVFYEMNLVLDGEVLCTESIKAEETVRTMLHRASQPSCGGEGRTRPKIAIFMASEDDKKQDVDRKPDDDANEGDDKPDGL